MENRLTTFGHNFQIKSISSLMTNSNFLAQIYDILDESHYDNESLKWIIGQCKSYYTEYKKPITLDVFKVRTSEIGNDILKATVVENLKEVFRYMEAPDLEFVQDQTLDFFKNQALKNAIVQSVDILESSGDYEQIKQLVDEAMKAGIEKNIGHEYVHDIEARYSETTRETIKTGWDIINELKRVCKKYAFMQEGPSWYFQSLPLNQSFWFFNIMINADFALAHNDKDKRYYEGLLEKKCFINPTLMIEDPISNNLLTTIDNRKGTIIGGNLVRWYGGFNSLIVANESGEKIYAPQMGRMEKDEISLEEINHLPYMQWNEWITKLSQFKYAVHLNPNTIGGTFHLNCAYLGIPCIGNIDTNTQKLCFPDLSIEPNDIKKGKELVKKLRKNKEFYVYCSNQSKKLYKKYFHESVYKTIWNKIILEYEK